jgi:hypothetical protein
MKNLLRLEELAQFLLCLGALIFLGAPWWIYLLLLLGPDIGMLGYLVNTKVGAFTYNMFHHKGIALLLILLGLVMMYPSIHGKPWVLDIFRVGLILFGHASMDRIFGYGLKFGDNFHHTHLGWIGKGKG